MLKVESLSFSYNNKDFILDKINLKLNKGFIYSLIGPNASGKSTFLKLLAGIYEPTKGSIYIYDKNLKNISYLKRRDLISFSSVDLKFLYPFSVFEFILLSDFKKNSKLFKNITKSLHLHNLLEKTLDKLSTGQLARVYLAQLLMQDAEVILIDELFSNMDFFYREKAIELLRTFANIYNKLIINIIHDLNLLVFSDFVIYLEDKNMHLQEKDLFIEKNKIDKLFNIDSKIISLEGLKIIFPYKICKVRSR